MIFGFFGRKKEIHMIDDGLKRAGTFSAVVPDAVKLTLWRLAKDRGLLKDNPEASLHDLAGFLSYCILGQEDFEDFNGPEDAKEMLRRLEMVKIFEDGIDAEIVLLTLHAGLADETTAGQYSIEAEADSADGVQS